MPSWGNIPGRGQLCQVGRAGPRRRDVRLPRPQALPLGVFELRMAQVNRKLAAKGLAQLIKEEVVGGRLRGHGRPEMAAQVAAGGWAGELRFVELQERGRGGTRAAAAGAPPSGTTQR